MPTSLGPFKFAPLPPPPSGFRAELVPVASPGALRIQLVNSHSADFTVDWGDGSPITYSSGLVNPGVVPTGTVIVECASTFITAFAIVDNQIKSTSITGGANLLNLAGHATNKSAFESFTIDTGAALVNCGNAFFNATSFNSFTVTDSDLSSVTTINSAFRNTALTGTFPAYTFSSSLTNMVAAFQDCTLTGFPASIETSGVTDGRQAFETSGLTSFPDKDFSACTDFIDMFRGCSDLVTVGDLQTEAGETFSGMFLACVELTTIGAIDTTATTGVSSGMFGTTPLLTSPNSTQQADLADVDGADFN